MSGKPLKISLCVATRGRPEKFARMRKSAYELAKFPDDIELIAYGNTDDDQISKYKDIDIGPPTSACQAWNMCASKAKGDILMMQGDAEIFMTQDWDLIVKYEFSNFGKKGMMVSPLDGRDNTGTPHYFIDRAWYNTLGWLAHPMFYHWNVDTYSKLLAEKAERFLWSKTTVKAEKIRKDATAKLSRDNRIVSRDSYALEWAKKNLIHIEAEKLRSIV